MYSIKTDLDITGAGTVGKDLLVKGNAVFKNNLTVNGSISFANASFTAIETETANITSTLDVAGKATLSGGLDVKGNTTIGSEDGGSDTATINANATFNGVVSVGGDFTQTAGSTALQETKVKSLEVDEVTTLKGNLTADVGTTAAFDKITANSAEITTMSTTDITSTGTAEFNDVNINGTLGGEFNLSDLNAETLNVTGASNQKGAVTFGANVTGINSTATFKDIRIGSNSESQTFRLSFPYSAPDKRPTVILQNEIQSELMSPAKLTVLTSATFGNASLPTYGITGNGLNKLDYLTVSGNDTQSPDTPLLEVKKGKTKVADFEVTGTATIPNIESTGTANFNNINVSGLLGGEFQLDDINATTLNVSGTTSLVGGVTLGSNITGLNGTATFKSISLGKNSQDPAVKLGFAYTTPEQRPTVILPNEVQSELVSPATLKVLKTATFGNASLSTYGITGNGLNKLDYLTITGNETQDPSTPFLQVGGKAILNDVDFTGKVTGLTVDVSGQDLTPKSVVAAEHVKGATLESTGDTTVGGALTVTGDITGTTATLSGALSAGSVSSGVITGTTSVSAPTISASTEVTAPTITASGTLSGETIKGTNITATSLTAPTISGETTFTENVDITGSLTVGSLDLSAAELNAKSITTTAGATVGGDLVVKGSFDLSEAELNVKSLTTSGVIKSNDSVSENVLPVLKSTTATITTVNADELHVTGQSNLSSVLVGTTLNVSGVTTTPSLVTPNISNEHGITIANNTKVTGDLTVSGAIIPGSIDLTKADVNANSITTTAGATVGGDLTVNGTVDLTNADVTAKSLTSTGAIVSKESSIASVLPKLESTDGTITTLGSTTANITNLKVTGTSTVADMTSSGKVKAVTIETPTISNDDGVSISNDTTITGNLTVSGTVSPGTIDLSQTEVNAKSITTTEGANIGGDLVVSGTVNLSGADVSVKSLTSSGIITVNSKDGINALPKVKSTEITTTTLNATNAVVAGDISAASANITGEMNGISLTLSGEETALTVTNNATISGALTVGSITSASETVSITKNTAITGDLAVSGTLTAGVIDLSKTDVSVKSLNSLGDATVHGNLTVDGSIDLKSANIVGVTLESTGSTTVGTDLVLTTGNITGNPSISGNMSVAGTTTLTGATTISSTLNTAEKLTVDAGGITVVSGDVQVDKGTITAPSANISGNSTLNSATVTTTLDVTGEASLNGGLTASTLDVTGDSSVQQLTVKGKFIPEGGLDLSGADLNVNSVSAAKTLSVTGASTLSGGVTTTTINASDKVTAKDLSTGTLEVTTNGTVGGTLGVTGKTTVGSLESGSISATSGTFSSTLDVTGAATFGNNVNITGTLTPGALDLTSTDVVANSLSVAQTLHSDGNATIGGTLDVTGNASASSMTLNGDDIALTVTNNVKVGGKLNVTGTATVGALTSEGSIKTGSSVIIGTQVGEHSETVQIFPNTYIAGSLRVDGGINADIDVSGQTIEPYAVRAANTISAAGNITSGAELISKSATIGDVGSKNNNLTINGNVVNNGDFTVTGILNATLNQSNSDVSVKSLTATNGVAAGTSITAGENITATKLLKGNTLEVTTTGSFGGAVTMSAGANVTGSLTVDGKLTASSITLEDATVTTITTSGAATLASASVIGEATIGGTLTVTGLMTANGSVVLGDSDSDTLTVNATSSFKENAVFDKGVTVTGHLSTTNADFTTTKVTTKKYDVIPNQVTSSVIAPSGTWTPDGTSNVYFITLDQDTTLAPITGLIGGGKASSVYIYVKQDSTGNRNFTTDGTYAVVDGTLNKTANSVTIYQVIYDGVSSVADMFIAQRTA